MLASLTIEHLLWLVAAVSGAAAVTSARLESERLSRHLCWVTFAAFLAGALVWMFGDTYAHHFAEKEQELRVSYWGSYREHEMWKAIVAAFGEQYPDIPVRREYITDRYEEKIQQLLLADAAPDIILFQDEPMPRFITSGKFEQLDDYCTRSDLPVDLGRDYWDTAVWSFQQDGKTYGIPIWGGDCLVIYNRAVFLDAGVAEPPEQWDTAQFLATCKALTGDTDRDGRLDRFGFAIPGWLYWLPFHYAFGATYLDATRTEWTLWGPEAEGSFGFWQDLRYKHHVSPHRDELTEGGNVPFMTGRVAMFISGPWAMPPLNEAEVDYDIAHIPHGPDGQHGTRVTWDCLAMFSKSQKKDWAWKFIHFATSLPAQRIIAQFQRSVPALKKAQTAFIGGNPKVHAERFVEAFSYARLQPISLHWALMSREVASETDLMLDNKQTPQEAMGRLVRNPQLSRHFRMPSVSDEGPE